MNPTRVNLLTLAVALSAAGTSCTGRDHTISLRFPNPPSTVSAGEEVILSGEIVNISSARVSTCYTGERSVVLSPGGSEFMFNSHAGCDRVPLEPGDALPIEVRFTAPEKSFAGGTQIVSVVVRAGVPHPLTSMLPARRVHSVPFQMAVTGLAPDPALHDDCP